MRIRNAGLVVLVACLGGAAFVVPAQAQSLEQASAVPSSNLDLTLEEVVALALRDNRDLRGLRMWRVLDRFDLFLAHRAYWPSGGVALSALRRKTDGFDDAEDWVVSPSLNWRSPVGTDASVGWSRREELRGSGDVSETFSASIRQPLLRGAGLDVNMAPLRQARIRAEQARMGEEEAVANLITQVTYSYRALIQAQERLVLATLSLDRSRNLLSTNEAMIEAGRMAQADIVQTQSEVANQEVSLLETERALHNARTRLLSLLALDPSTPLVAVDEGEVVQVQLEVETAVEMALSQRRDLRSQRLNFEQLEITEQLARNGRLWDVSLVAGYDRYSAGAGLGEVSSRSVGVQLNIPLGDFSSRRNLMGARTSLHTAELNYQGQVERVEGQVRDAVADVRSRWHQLEAAQRARDLALRSLDIQQERLQAGRATNFEVLSLQNNLRSADAQALSARMAYLNALTALDQELGRTLETWQVSIEP